MNLNRFLKSLGVAAAVAFTSLSAHAVACGGSSTADVTFSGDGIILPDANGTESDNCGPAGSGSDKKTDNFFGYTNWEYVAKTQWGGAGGPGTAASDTFTLSGITFLLTYDGPTVGGFFDFSISASGAPLPQIFDLAFIIKQGSGYVPYLFEDAVVYSGANAGTFRVSFGPGDDEFSHFSLYARDPQLCNGDCETMKVPEPGTLALLGAGLAGLALLRRRRRY